jgi:SAM-dependent methyltransferase
VSSRSVRPASYYDRKYFDKWYRHPRHRVKSKTDIDRQLRFVLAAAEFILERPVKRVLDVGAGEGTWGMALRRISPGTRYYGVDPSEYAVSRFGKTRNIQLGGFADLPAIDLPGDFDLVLCCGVMNYVASTEIRAGLEALARMTAGLAYFEVFAAEDEATGDFDKQSAKPARWWRSLFRRTGWTSLGMQLYVRSDMDGLTTRLERGV